MKDKWAEIQKRVAKLPNQAATDEPHWIVVGWNRIKNMPEERQVRVFFRHPTEESADAEAKRLAAKFPGKRFGVYQSGPSYAIEIEIAAEPMRVAGGIAA